MRTVYAHTYASIPGRGAHKGKKTIEKWFRTDPKNTQYCFKMDIKKFFDNISHDLLKKKLRRLIKDNKFYNVLSTIIDATESGLPLGFYTSQWFANWFLQDLDYYIKHQLKAKYYIRYMDDIVIFADSSVELHNYRKAIAKYLETIGLQMKENWRIFKVTDRAPVDFMGFKFYRNRTTIRSHIFLKMTRKARKISKKENPTVYDSRQALTYLGYIKVSDCYRSYERNIKPYINIQQLKHLVSKNDRRNSK